MRYQPRLDAVRGICIAAVFLNHASFLKCGWVGVQVFFVLSGYLITDILVRAKDSDIGVSRYFLNFYVRRVLRIFPVYFAYLAVVFLADYLIDSPWIANTEPHSAQNAPYLLTYTYNLYRTTSYTSEHSMYFAHLWSLSVEEQFYLLWPLVVFISSRRALLLVCLVLIAAGPLIRLLELWWRWNPGQYARILIGRFVYFFTPSHADAFAFGALLNFVRDSKAIERYFEQVKQFVRPGVPLVGLWMLLLSFVAGYNVSTSTLGWPTYLPYFFAFIWGYTLLNAWALVAIDDWRHKSLIADNRFLQRLGRVSYGFYIFHFPVIWLVRLAAGVPSTPWTWQNVWESSVAFLITWAIAEASFRYLESPFLRLKSRFKHIEPAANRAGQVAAVI